MQSLIDVHGRYEIPTGWHEVTGRQFCELDRLKLATVEQRASYFAGRPIQVNGYVADTLAFLIPAVDGSYRLPTEGGYPYPADLGSESYLQVESIRTALSMRPLHECYGEVYGIFVARLRNYVTGEYEPSRIPALIEEANRLPVSQTFPAIAHLYSEMARLAKAPYDKLQEPDTTEAGQRAMAAGAEELSKFGHFNVAYAYNVKLSVSLNTLYQMPWSTIATMMVTDRINAEIQDRMNRNSQPNHE